MAWDFEEQEEMKQCLQHSFKFSQNIKYEEKIKIFLDSPGL